MNKFKSKSFHKHITQVLAMILSLALMLSLAVLPAAAETSGDYGYSILDDGTVEITYYSGSDTEIVIPSKLDDKKVTSIALYAFSDHLDITGITIPNSVTKIGTGAFANCAGLKSISIPDSVTSISDEMFSSCNSLESITIPDSVKSIGACAFSYCYSLENITIPDGVKKIEHEAFLYCTDLTSIAIPDSVTSIGFDAFYGCEKMTIYGNAGSFAEKYARNMGFNFSLLSPPATFGDYNYKTLTDGTVEIIKYTGSDAEIVIPAEIEGKRVTSIGEIAFMNCSTLTSVTIPEGVTNIGFEAFFCCSALETINIPDSITRIQDAAFAATAWLDNQPDGVVYLGKIAYKYKGKMPSDTEITFKDGTKGIADSAFALSQGLTGVTIPDTVTFIGWNAFNFCSNLKSVDIPDSVTSIGGWAFCNCSGLADIKIPDSVTSVGNFAFSYTPWLNNQPDGLLYAGKVAYKYLGEMPENTEIVLKDGTTAIGGWAFDDCSGLTSITIPDSVTTIGDHAFVDCENLKSVIIPDSVTTIDDYAFGYYLIPFTNAPPIKYDDFTISGYAGTAAEEYANDNGFEFIALEPVTVPGDVNGDGEVTLTDSINIQKAALSMKELSEQALKNADLNGDGKLSVIDAIIAQKIALKMIV